MGPGRAEAVEAMNVNNALFQQMKASWISNNAAPQGAIRDYARDICGIALSNDHCIPSMFTACLVIGIGECDFPHVSALTPDAFTDERYQLAICFRNMPSKRQ